MRLITRRRVVQAEFFVLQQVAVVRQEGDAVIHFERAFPLELEIADGIERTRKVALLFQFPFTTLFGTGMTSTVKG